MPRSSLVLCVALLAISCGSDVVTINGSDLAAPVVDAARAPDLAMAPPDLAVEPPDLATLPDLSRPPDLARPIDLAQGQNCLNGAPCGMGLECCKVGVRAGTCYNPACLACCM